jgi:hypothetical protein
MASNIAASASRRAGSAARQADESGAGRADGDVKSVGDLLDRIDAAARRHEPTSFGDVLETVGNRSFGPLLLLAGLVMLAPVVGDIPGVPVMMGLLVILTTGQFLAGRDHFWLPGWLVRRSVSHEKIRTGVRWLRPVGRLLDRWSRPRLTHVLHGAGLLVSAVACTVLAAATPLMEVVPFSANIAGIAITAFGLAMIASDGVVALLAIAFSAGTFTLLVRHFLS